MTDQTLNNFLASAHHKVPYHEGLAFTSPKNHCIYYLPNNICDIQNLVGDGNEGHRDGVYSNVMMYQPCGITIKRDIVIYFCDVRSSTMRMCTPLNLTAIFLQNVRKIYDAFSIHSKGDENKNVTSLSDAINTVASSNEYFQQERRTLGEALNTTKVLNGPEESVSNVSMQSLDLLEWSLRNLEKLTNSFSFQHTNLGSSTTRKLNKFTQQSIARRIH